MNTLVVISPHSFVDIITNSSSELFVCETKKSLDMVKEIMEDIKSENPDKDCDYVDPYLLETEDDVQEFLMNYKEFLALDEIYFPEYTRDKKEYDRRWKQYEKDMKNWVKKEVKSKKWEGKIIIVTEESNSIDYRLFEEINDIFHATNYHLG